MIGFENEVVDGEIAGGNVCDQCEVSRCGFGWRRVGLSSGGSGGSDGGEESKSAQEIGG